MDTILLVYAYCLFFLAGTVVGALWHEKVLIGIERFCALIRTWFIE